MAGKMLTTEAEVAELLSSIKRVAVVGASKKPERPSHRISQYLLDHDYQVVPVNPAGGEILQQTVARSLQEISGGVDLVDVFRNPATLDLALVDQTLAVGAKALWLQDGVIRQDIADKAVQAGLLVVMDDCVMRRHKQLF